MSWPARLRSPTRCSSRRKPSSTLRVKKNTDTLLAGVSKDAFSLNLRSRIELRDIELIVKDLLRKQETLKKLDSTLAANSIEGCLKKSKDGVVADADSLRSALGFAVADLQAKKNKEAALGLLIERFEAKQLLVSQSQQNFMPQNPGRRILAQHLNRSGGMSDAIVERRPTARPVDDDVFERDPMIDPGNGMASPVHHDVPIEAVPLALGFDQIFHDAIVSDGFMRAPEFRGHSRPIVGLGE